MNRLSDITMSERRIDAQIIIIIQWIKSVCALNNNGQIKFVGNIVEWKVFTSDNNTCDARCYIQSEFN